MIFCQQTASHIIFKVMMSSRCYIWYFRTISFRFAAKPFGPPNQALQIFKIWTFFEEKKHNFKLIKWSQPNCKYLEVKLKSIVLLQYTF